jgi:hypothetical protein
MKAQYKFILSGLLLMTCGAGPETSADAFAARYAAAKSPRERFDIAIEVIDAELIRDSGPLDDAKTIFGDDLKVMSVDENHDRNPERLVAIVNFAPLTGEPGGNAARAHTGWYLHIDCSLSGVVRKYYLSNMHKSIEYPPRD